uniref:exopolysaccharide biosynthesis polyprenyl glycosylphosphotransferase n=1 Tax=Orrella sp. TaxID=1921583 RepID=UPI004047AD46
MIQLFTRQDFSRQTLLGVALGWLCGALSVVGLSSYLSWFADGVWLPDGSAVLIGGTVFVFGLSAYITSWLRRHDIERSAYISTFFIVGVLFLGLFAILLFSRVYYSRSFLITAFVTTLVVLYGVSFLQQRRFPLVYGVLPSAHAGSLQSNDAIRFVELSSFDEPLDEFDVLIAHFEGLSPEWQAVAANATSRGFLVYGGTEFLESYTGRVSLAGLYAYQAKEFKLHPVYAGTKRVIDILVSIVTLPFLLLLTIVVASLIKAESSGPVFYRQVRVGQGGKTFTILKFRSMVAGADQNGHDFAQVNDLRVTRIGRFMRRSRLDELPQLINVLRGEMSLIGPRPEQVGFVEEFQERIPFYAYRHMVKPGISGWAQVSHGYAACLSSAQEKLEYDLYYAKHCSFWLDTLITLRTFRTILTGFGMR